MTNLQAMQDERLRELIRDVELLTKLYHNIIVPSDESESILKERISLQEQITERWRELMEEGNMTDLEKLEQSIDEIVTKTAIVLYFKHMELDQDLFPYMWSQCSEDYRNAWKTIAYAEHEDLIRELRESYKVYTEGF